MRYAQSIKDERLMEKYKRLASDKNLTDRNDDLALLRAFCEITVERASEQSPEMKDWEMSKINAVVGMVERIGKLVESIKAIEVKEKFVVHMDSVTDIIDKVVDILQRHIQDPILLSRIAAELGNVVVNEKNDASATQNLTQGP